MGALMLAHMKLSVSVTLDCCFGKLHIMETPVALLACMASAALYADI
jgi:hypothetical protein